MAGPVRNQNARIDTIRLEQGGVKMGYSGLLAYYATADSFTERLGNIIFFSNALQQSLWFNGVSELTRNSKRLTRPDIFNQIILAYPGPMS